MAQKNNGDTSQSNILGEIRRPANMDSLPDLVEFVGSIERQQNLSEKRIEEVGTALREAVANVVQHAYKGRDGEIAIACRLDYWGKLLIQVTDKGDPFNILIADVSFGGEEDPMDAKKKASARLIKRLVDNIEYKRVEQMNVLTFTVTNVPRGT